MAMNNVGTGPTSLLVITDLYGKPVSELQCVMLHMC